MGKAVTESAARRAALNDKPIEKYGLKLWGIKMGRYEEWAKCKNVWLARQSTFPVFCISMSFLEALFALDTDAINSAGKPLGYLYTVMYVLGMALRLDEDCVRDGDIYITGDDEGRTLRAICVKTGEMDEPIEITPGMFSEIREIISWMQGERIPDESLNDELLEAERDLSERGAPPLKYDVMDMEASVALQYGVRTRDVLEWPILEFETARRAIDRDKKHLICGIGATNGCKWENGNPYPSWCFDREATGSGALIAQNQFGRTKKTKG